MVWRWEQRRNNKPVFPLQGLGDVGSERESNPAESGLKQKLGQQGPPEVLVLQLQQHVIDI